VLVTKERNDLQNVGKCFSVLLVVAIGSDFLGKAALLLLSFACVTHLYGGNSIEQGVDQY
jgi:hypothetical protein